MLQTRHLRRAAALCFVAAAAVSAARADITFFSGPGAIQPDENVLFNDPGLISTGLTVTGKTNQTGTTVFFTGNETLTTPSGGQARIDAVDGSFTSLLINLGSGLSFTQLELNPDLTANGMFRLTVTEIDGTTSFRDFSGSGAGQNFVSVRATNNQFIQSALLSAPTNTIDDVAQIRIGPIFQSTAGGPPQQVVIPEPGTLALVGASLLPLAGILRRRRRA